MLIFLKHLWYLFFTPENWTLDNLLTLISLSFALAGGAFALKQWVASNKARRIDYLERCIEKIRLNKDFCTIYYKLEYEKLKYPDNFHGHEDEPTIDALLSHLNFICYLFNIGDLSPKDMQILQYYLDRICSSSPIQSYLWNIYHMAKSEKHPCSFIYLIQYGINQGIIDRHYFYDKESDQFIKHLPF